MILAINQLQTKNNLDTDLDFKKLVLGDINLFDDKDFNIYADI